MKLEMTIMCSMLNYQVHDFEELLQQRRKQTKKTNGEPTEIIMPTKILLSCKY
jgi:hypothetical protein